MHIDLAKTSLSILPASRFFLSACSILLANLLGPLLEQILLMLPFPLEKFGVLSGAGTLQEMFQSIYQLCCKMNCTTAVFLLEE